MYKRQTLENTYDGKQIINATNNSCILEDIFKMENEFEEVVGENGHKLSGGQKQRVAIARNIITDKDFIISVSYTHLNPNSQDEHSIYVEIEIEVTCCAYEEKQINLIQDMYSPTQNLTFEKKQITTMTNKQNVTTVSYTHLSPFVPKIIP